MILEEELQALRLLAEGRQPGVLKAGIIAKLLADGLVERHLGSWALTSRGHAVLLRTLSGTPLDDA